ncbi:MAG: phage tail protein [Geminicoccaceae bacterium]
MPSKFDGDDDYKATSKEADLRIATIEERLGSLQKMGMYAVVVAAVVVAIFMSFLQLSFDSRQNALYNNLKDRSEDTRSRLGDLEKELSSEIDKRLDEFRRAVAEAEKQLNSQLREFPIGTIVPILATSRPPEGWLPCDGRRITKDEHPALYATLVARNPDQADVRIPDLTDAFVNKASEDIEGRIFWFVKAK